MMLPRWRPVPLHDGTMTSHTFGSTLVLHQRDRLSASARGLALAVADDVDRQVVVVDMPDDSPFSMWREVAELMPRARSGVRVMVGGRTRETTALAGQWLAERLRCPVIAPDGRLVEGVGGALFVDGGGASGWTRYSPGRPPAWEARRFPRPLWECDLMSSTTTVGRIVAEPVLGGIWLRPDSGRAVTTDPDTDAAIADHRALLHSELPCQHQVFALVVGCPGGPAVALHDVKVFWESLPPDIRGMGRVVVYGPVTAVDDTPFGQQLADALGTAVVAWAGLPGASRVEPDLHVVHPDGSRGWPSFALELMYFPADPDAGHAPPPHVLSHRAPVPAAREIGPGVYWYAPDAVVEVVQAGLWVRSPVDPEHADELRRLPADPQRPLVLFERGRGESEGRMRPLAEEVLAQLDEGTRKLCRVVVASSVIGEFAPSPALAVPVEEVPVADEAEDWIDGEQITGRRAGHDGRAPAAQQAISAAPAEGALPVEAPTAPLTSPSVAGLSDTDMPQGISRNEVLRDVPDPYPVAEPTASPVSVPPVAAPVNGAPLAPSPVAVSPLSAPPVPASRHAASPIAASAPVASAPAASAIASRRPKQAPSPEREPAPRVGLAEAASLQPVPTPDALAMVPAGGLDDERTWLRQSLGADFSRRSTTVSRVLSQHPGMNGGGPAGEADLLADAVAVRLYLEPDGETVDQSLRRSQTGPHTALARCAASGLVRLPTHRGPVVVTAQPSPEQWTLLTARRHLTEWGFLHALTGPCETRVGDSDIVIWSMTARRTRLLEPDEGAVEDRVVFTPGTHFKVLEALAPSGAERGRLLVRELSSDEIGDDGRVADNRRSLDAVARASLISGLETWSTAPAQRRLPDVAADRFAQLPGLLGAPGVALGRRAA